MRRVACKAQTQSETKFRMHSWEGRVVWFEKIVQYRILLFVICSF
jgi:hypothetical protein